MINDIISYMGFIFIWIKMNYEILNLILIFATMCSASYFANYQIKQNDRSYNHEIANRYIENYYSLMSVLEKCRSLWYVTASEREELLKIEHSSLKSYYDKKFEIIFSEISTVMSQAKLMLSDEISEIVGDVYTDINNVINLRNKCIEQLLWLESVKQHHNDTNIVINLDHYTQLADRYYQEVLDSQINFINKYFPANNQSNIIHEIMKRYQKYTKVVK